MKSIPEMTKFELAAYVQTALEKSGIQVVLSGGTAVSYYSENQYVSYDLDLVNIFAKSRKQIETVMVVLGFVEVGKYFTFPETQFFIEFPPGPLTVGMESVKEVSEVKMETGNLRIISATDCVKDRLAAYFHWGDQPSLLQAKLIRKSQKVDLDEVQRWAIKEGKLIEFQNFVVD